MKNLGIKNLKNSFFYKLLSHKPFSTKKTVFLFGGQGNQQKGMLDKVLQNPQVFSFVQSQSEKLGIDIIELATTDINNRINITQYSQPLLLLSQYLTYFYGQKAISISNYKAQNTYSIGHSLGEYSSLVMAGSINLTQCLQLVRARGSLMIKISNGQVKFGNLIIKYRQDKYPKILQKVKHLGLEISCYNSPSNLVVSGCIEPLNELKNYMKSDLRIVSKVLPAATAFHSSYLQGMRQEFKSILQTIEFKTPTIKILRNLDCKIYQTRQDIVEGLSLQNTSPVLFRQSVEKIVKEWGKDNLEFIQIGHKDYLGRWVDQVIKLN